jgi:type III restriction enzyme
MYFGGFGKCLYDRQNFDSDSERRFSVILEQDDSVLKWFKPMNDRSIRIDLKDGSSYRPDFIVEGQNGKFICEPKMRKEMEDSDVIAKAQAARTWCQRATEYEVANGGKPWKYVLIPHDVIAENMKLAGLTAQFTVTSSGLERDLTIRESC